MPREHILNGTEREVLRALILGGSVVAVAQNTGRNIATIRSHMKNLHAKTDTHSLVELVTWALANYTVWAEDASHTDVAKPRQQG